jgi:hypothetical protein
MVSPVASRRHGDHAPSTAARSAAAPRRPAAGHGGRAPPGWAAGAAAPAPASPSAPAGRSVPPRRRDGCRAGNRPDGRCCGVASVMRLLVQHRAGLCLQAKALRAGARLATLPSWGFTNPRRTLHPCSMNVLVWLKRDLRVQDHPALTLAPGWARSCRSMWSSRTIGPARHLGPAVGVCRRKPGRSARPIWPDLGLPLIVRTGDAVEVLARLVPRHASPASSAMRKPATLDLCPRPAPSRPGRAPRGWNGPNFRNPAWCAACGTATAGQALRDGFMAAPVALPPLPCAPCRGWSRGRSPPPAPCGWPRTAARTASAAAAPTADPARQLSDPRGEPYRAAMSSPLTGERACSRLSPHFALGTLSMREVVQATTASAGRTARRALGQGALTSFQARLAWRDHFMQKLEDQPASKPPACHPPPKPAPARPRCRPAGRLDRAKPACPFWTPACAICGDRLAEFPHAGDGDGGRLLSPLAGLAGHRAGSGAAVHRLRTRHPLAAGADAIGHHRRSTRRASTTR